MKVLQKIYVVCTLVLILATFSSCATDKYEVVLIEESYEHSIKHKSFVYPATVDGWTEKDALKTDTDDGEFFCFTEDTAEADDFINAQRTLLNYLRACGMEIGQLEYYGTDYGFCFSDSSNLAAYVDLTLLRTWQQVLVTLQALWGDYTDYGYVYAMSNAIAFELGWQTDEVLAVENATMKAFFTENPEAINLLYPSFTTKLASEETVNYSKALATKLFERIKWHKVIAKPIKTQLDKYYELVDDYAKSISTEFVRQTCGYAYYGENVLLRIMTTYMESIIDANYSDEFDIYEDYFSDYKSIFRTANNMDAEISAAVEYFGLEDKAGVVRIKWLDHKSDAAQKFASTGGTYFWSTRTAYILSIKSYMHEYYHHIQYLINPELGHSWQAQVFCELGSSNSWYSQYYLAGVLAQNKQAAEVVYAYAGHTYQLGKDDYFETYDIITYFNNKYVIGYDFSGPDVMNSFGRYLIDMYGEVETYNLLLFPDTVREITEKTWDELQAEWEEHIRGKYAAINDSHNK